MARKMRHLVSLDGYTMNVVLTTQGRFVAGASEKLASDKYIFQHLQGIYYRISRNDGTDLGFFKLVPGFRRPKTEMHFNPLPDAERETLLNKREG